MGNVLAKMFTRKGELNINRSRMMITYTQIKDSGDGVYIYKIDYDGSVHYTTFLCDYYEFNGEVFELYPDERSFMDGRALNTMTLEEATDVYYEFVEQNKKLWV